MRCVKNIFIIFGLLGASQFIYGDDHGSQMQTPIPVEFWGCEFNDGKTMDDLMPVIKEWKKTMGKQDYVGWVMTPTFVSEAIPVRWDSPGGGPTGVRWERILITYPRR